MAKKNEVVKIKDEDLIRTLQTSLYVGASPESIAMVINYCREAKLDPLQKPVHIVPMWDPTTRQKRDVIMQGIGHYRIQAERSGQYAGITEPEFGDERKSESGIKFPDWCKITVKRKMTGGIIAEFTAKEFWLENYAIKGGKEKDQSPNAMWSKRPYGQLAKCTEAQALRKAFPELLGSAPTVDEMIGKELETHDISELVEVEQPKSKTETKPEVKTEPPETIIEEAPPPMTAKQLETKLVACTTTDEVQELFPLVDAMDPSEIKDHLMIIGKTKFKELKKAAKAA